MPAGERCRRAVCGRTARTVRCGGGRQPRTSRPRPRSPRKPPADPTKHTPVTHDARSSTRSAVPTALPEARVRTCLPLARCSLVPSPRRKPPSRRRRTIAIDGERRATRPRRGDRNATNAIARTALLRTTMATKRSSSAPSSWPLLAREAVAQTIACLDFVRLRQGNDSGVNHFRRGGPALPA
jgi:hypothetical protein